MMVKSSNTCSFSQRENSKDAWEKIFLTNRLFIAKSDSHGAIRGVMTW